MVYVHFCLFRVSNLLAHWLYQTTSIQRFLLDLSFYDFLIIKSSSSKVILFFWHSVAHECSTPVLVVYTCVIQQVKNLIFPGISQIYGFMAFMHSLVKHFYVSLKVGVNIGTWPSKITDLNEISCYSKCDIFTSESKCRIKLANKNVY